MDKQEFLDSCAAYALRILDDEDLIRFEAVLKIADSEMIDFYKAAISSAEDLSLAAPEQELSSSVFDKLMARVEATESTLAPIALVPLVPPVTPLIPLTPVPPKTRIAWILPFQIAMTSTVALVLLTLGLVAYISGLKKDRTELKYAVVEKTHQILALEDSLSQKNAMLDVIRSNKMEVVVMNGLEADPSGYGKIIWDPVNKKAILHISNLPKQPSNKDYQLWVIRDKKPVDAGLFQVSDNRSGGQLYKIDNLVESNRSRINAFAVTLEPKGGVPQPTGKMYLLGSI